MYLLDTNIVSMLDPRRHPQAPELISWLERNGASLYLSVMTITELDAGVLKLRRDNKAGRADEIANTHRSNPDGLRRSRAAARCRSGAAFGTPQCRNLPTASSTT